MCSGANPRSTGDRDAVDERLEALGLRVTHSEGYKQAEWVLLDYVDCASTSSRKARQFYDLERLWKSAKRLEPSELLPKPKPRRTAPTKTASPRPLPRRPRRRGRKG